MKLDAQFKIENDENNFKLIEIKIAGEDSKNPGQERESVFGYYGTLEYALKAYINGSLRKELPSNAELVLNKLDLLNSNIEMFCKEHTIKTVEVDPLLSKPFKYEDTETDE